MYLGNWRGRLVLVLVLCALGVACSGQDEPVGSPRFCRAVEKYNDELERQFERGEIDPERELERVEELARTAPKAIEEDAATFRDALRAVVDDPSIKDDPAIKVAVDNVNRYANKACGLYSGGGAF